MLKNHIYAIGGHDHGLTGSIECHEVGTSSDWITILEDHELIKSSLFAVTAISSNKIAIYGGIARHGVIFHTVQKSVTKILGSSSDVKFDTFSQVQWIGKNRYLTLCCDTKDKHVQMVQLKYEDNDYAECRAI